VARGLNIAFAGTPDPAAVILRRLLEDGTHRIIHVFTQPDRPAGRGRRPRPGPVKQAADAAGLPLSQPQTAAELQAGNILAGADVLAVVAFGLLLPEVVIHRPRYGSVNVHFSLLPRWRGAAPVQRAIEAGDDQSGVTIMQMDAGLDTGAVLLQQSCPIHPDDTAGSLQDRLAGLGGDCLLKALDQLGTASLVPVPQDERLATYAAKVDKREAEIDWTQPAALIERRIRAFNPSPVARTSLYEQPMRIWAARVLETPRGDRRPGDIAACTTAGLDVAAGDRLLRIEALQLPGKKKVSAREFYHGHPRFHKQSY
jgi:methionyl-tRNA formyltransferase